MTTLEQMRTTLRDNINDVLHGSPNDASLAMAHIADAIDDAALYLATIGYLGEVSAIALRAARADMPVDQQTSFALFPTDEHSPRRAAHQIITALANDDRPMAVAIARPYAILDPHTQYEAEQLLGAVAGLAINLHRTHCLCGEVPTL